MRVDKVQRLQNKETAVSAHLSKQQVLDKLSAVPVMSPYDLLCPWSFLFRAVWLCNEVHKAPLAIFLSGQLLRAFKSVGQGEQLMQFMHKVRSENKGMSLFGWQEAFRDIDVHALDKAVKDCAVFWPRSLLIYFVEML